MVRTGTRLAVCELADKQTDEIQCCVAYIRTQRGTTALDNAGDTNARYPKSH
jgi:hypothetical protein